MVESITDPKKHLALETDWLSGITAAGVLLVCFLLIGRDVRQVLTSAPVRPGVSWSTVILLLASVWAVTIFESRVLRLGFALLILASGSRLAMHLMHASVATQMMNAQVMRVINAIAFIAFCVHLIQWFKRKIKHV